MNKETMTTATEPPICTISLETYQHTHFDTLKEQALKAYARMHPQGPTPSDVEFRALTAGMVGVFPVFTPPSPTAAERDEELKALNAELLERFAAFEKKHGLVLDYVYLDRVAAFGSGEWLRDVHCEFRTKKRF